MADIVGAGAGEIGGGEVVKVLLCDEDAHALIIDVEEILAVGEGVGGAHVLDAGEGDGDGVALREREHEFGFERTLDMQVQLERKSSRVNSSHQCATRKLHLAVKKKYDTTRHHKNTYR